MFHLTIISKDAITDFTAEALRSLSATKTLRFHRRLGAQSDAAPARPGSFAKQQGEPDLVVSGCRPEIEYPALQRQW